MALLSAAMMGRLERLQLATRRPLAGHLAGAHRSQRYGSSLDFADYRNYNPGDDFRLIDYHLLARLNVLLIKLFEADDELNLRILMDTSASMGSDGKLAHAKRLAAAVGFVALVRRDTVNVYTFPRNRPAPRFASRHATAQMFHHLEELTAIGPTTMVQAARHQLSMPGKPGLTVLISDLLTSDWDRGISRLLARGSDLVVVHVLSQAEVEPSFYGDLEIIDRETKERLPVSLTPETLGSYHESFAAWLDRVATRCRHLGAAYIRTLADDDLESLLLTRWMQGGVFR
ncbi:MAG: DUF58 domain-containing protein [Acidimicrobiaceae bacterium]|nr:DUF58 domain-containing protein [Acidimicrobiaceae bacterium]